MEARLDQLKSPNFSSATKSWGKPGPYLWTQAEGPVPPPLALKANIEQFLKCIFNPTGTQIRLAVAGTCHWVSTQWTEVFFAALEIEVETSQHCGCINASEVFISKGVIVMLYKLNLNIENPLIGNLCNYQKKTNIIMDMHYTFCSSWGH